VQNSYTLSSTDLCKLNQINTFGHNLVPKEEDYMQIYFKNVNSILVISLSIVPSWKYKYLRYI